MNIATQYEIDFLPVGEGDTSGDAIAIRYGDGKEWRVMVYDGGTKTSGEQIVEHIKKHYGTNHVDFLVNSHPDQDHASGLSVVMENLSVGELWIHRPWLYAGEVLDNFKDERITENSLAQRFKDKMPYAWALEEMALQKGIKICEPYQGNKIGEFTVLSPSKDWYLHTLIPEFSKTPEPKELVTESSFANKAVEALRSVIDWIQETWDIETLRDDVETSADNESSAVLYTNIDGRGIFLCGDAGIRGLSRASDYADIWGQDLPNAKFYQIPHHGGRHNVSTAVLDKIVGNRLPIGASLTKTAFVSAGKGSSKHPKKMVVNAFIRRGANVVQTKGTTICSHHGTPSRQGWTKAPSVPFSDEVESWN